MVTFSFSPLRRRGLDSRVDFCLLLVIALASLALPAQPQQSDANIVPTVQTSPGPSSNSLSPINIQYPCRIPGLICCDRRDLWTGSDTRNEQRVNYPASRNRSN